MQNMIFADGLMSHEILRSGLLPRRLPSLLSPVVVIGFCAVSLQTLVDCSMLVCAITCYGMSLNTLACHCSSLVRAFLNILCFRVPALFALNWLWIAEKDRHMLGPKKLTNLELERH